jgi:outer membrane protein assembly factor BamB
LNPDRTIRWTHAPVWGRFVAPPTVGPDGTVYIEDSFRVWHALNPDGSARWYLQSFTGSWDSSGTGRPASVAPDGTIYLIGEELTPHDGVLPEGGYYSNAASNRTITLNAVDPDDGSVLWSFVADYQINCSPTIAPDGTTYFTDTAGVLYSINPEGGENWRLPLDALEVHQLAVGTDGLLYVVHSEPDDAFVDLLQAIEPDGSTRFIWDQSERWITNLLVDAAGRAVFLDDFTGDVVCLEPDGEVLWRCDTGSHLVYQIAVNDAGWLYVFNGFGSMVFDGEGSS